MQMLNSNKVIIYMQRLYPFCNIHMPDDRVQKYLGTN